MIFKRICLIDLLNTCAHCVDGIDGAENYGILEASGIISDTDGFKVWHDGEVLPYFFYPVLLFKFFPRMASDSRTASKRSLVIAPKHLTPSPAWEWLAEDHFIRKSQFQSAGSHFVFEELAEGFYELELKVFREAAHVMMGFYDFGCFGTAFHNIR